MNQDKSTSGSRKSFLRIKQSVPAADFGEGDGLDPRHERRRGGVRGKPDYSSERLRNRLREAIGLATSLPAVPGLDSFVVADVAYAGRGNCYSVVVYCEDPERNYDPEEVRGILIARKGTLRADIANAITRKKVPDLVFMVLPPGTSP